MKSAFSSDNLQLFAVAAVIGLFCAVSMHIMWYFGFYVVALFGASIGYTMLGNKPQKSDIEVLCSTIGGGLLAVGLALVIYKSFILSFIGADNFYYGLIGLSFLGVFIIILFFNINNDGDKYAY